MTESILTISIVGLLAGFIFSMPIAGPISILITSNALKGRYRYCNLANIGASFATFTYVFIAVFGLTKLYSVYKPAIPYLFSTSSIFLILLGYRIFRTKIDIEHLEEINQFNEKIKKKEKGGFYTGCIINFLNPTLFIGWLTSTFLVISFVASLGLNTGGLDIFVDQSVKDISSIEDSITEVSEYSSLNKIEIVETHGIENYHENLTSYPSYFHLVLSVSYAFFISIGSISWFYILVILIARFRRRISIKILTGVINSLGIVLCMFGFYFGYLAVRMFINLKMV